MSRSLIVVDVQNDFCEGDSVPVTGGAQIATAIAGLVEQTMGSDCQYIVATRDHHIDPGSHFSDSPDLKNSSPVHCVAGYEGGEFHPTSHSPPPAERSTPSSSRAPTAPPRAASKAPTNTAHPWWTGCVARGVEDVDVVGIATDHCVRATALDAVKAGFRGRVLRDYSVGVAPDTTASALDDFRQAGVAVSGQTPAVS
ncbi:isochorismatase family protein [Streptomyces sp. NPDC046409]|uniref:isochorismatase family protein n=1 Tax=Streptomyces sp. NPDC046409 TaxID=3156675 RepID=UPI0033DF5EA8